MELENGVKERIQVFNGQKSALVEALSNNADCEKILDFVTRRGRLRKVWGGSLYANPDIDGAQGEVKWVDRFDERWIYQQGKCISLETVEAAANFVKQGEILLGDDNRIHSTRWVDLLFMTNGCEVKFKEKTPDRGEFFLDLGLRPPGNGRKWVENQDFLTLTKVAASGSTLADATYGYVFTFWDANRRVESLPWGAQVGEDGLWRSFAYGFADSTRLAFASMTNNAVRVDISTVKALGYDTSRVTHFIIYRQTQADPTVLKRVADPDSNADEPYLRIANDYYDDSTVEADLGLILDESISPPPTGKYYYGYGDTDRDANNFGPKFIEQFRDQLWLYGAEYPGTENGTEVQPDGVGAKQIQYYKFSSIAYASQVGNPEYFQYTYDIARANGQRPTGMKKHRNVLMFFKEKSAFYLDGSNPDNYEIREMDPDRGFTVSGSISTTTMGVIGLGQGGFTLFNGVSIGEIISESVHDMVERINLSYAHKIYATFDPEEEKYECHVPLDTATYNNYVFVYDLKSRSWSFTRKAAGASAYAINSSKRTVGISGDKQNGRLYLITDRSAVTWNGQTLHGIWRSRQLDFGALGELKALQVVKVTARAKRDFRLSMDIVVDMGQRDGIRVEDIDPDIQENNLASGPNDAEGSLWDEAQWSAGVVRKTFTIIAQAVGEKFQIVLRNSDTDADTARFEIEEVLAEASLLDGDDD